MPRPGSPEHRIAWQPGDRGGPIWWVRLEIRAKLTQAWLANLWGRLGDRFGF